MSQEIFTFSVSTKDTETLRQLHKIKKNCKHTGKSFSKVCIEALRKPPTKSEFEALKEKLRNAQDMSEEHLKALQTIYKHATEWAYE